MLQGINHITLSVNDVEESFHFYVEILGCKPIQKNPISAYVVAGEIWLALDKSQNPNARPASDYSHVAFTVAADTYPEIKRKLIAYGVKSWAENKTEGESYYFLDPNGHKLELATSNLANRIKDAKKNWNWGDQITWFV
jgi:catechol 2,3-dioxygenase-like lactoylglutathione lyase family enzyme